MAINPQKLLPPSKLSTPAERMAFSYDRRVDDILSTPAERMAFSYDRRVDDILNLNIKRKFINVDKLLKNSFLQKKKEEKKKKTKKQTEARQEKEKNLELPKGIQGLQKVKSLIPRTGILDAIQRFAVFTFVGWLFTKFSQDLPKLMGIVNAIVPIANTTEKIIGGIFEGIVGFIDAGYKAHDQMRALSKDIGGEQAQKVYDEFSTNFNRFLNAVLTFGLSELGRGNEKPPEAKSGGGMVRGYARGGQTTRGGKVVGDKIERTLKIQKFKTPQKVQPEKVTPGKDVGGKKRIEKLYPNPKSTTSKRQPNPYKALTGVSESLDKGGWIGELMSAGVKIALGQKVNANRIAKSISGGMSSLSQAEQGGINTVSRSILGMAEGGLIPIMGGNNRVAESVLSNLIQNRINEALKSVNEELIKTGGTGLTSRGGGGGEGSSFSGEIEYGPIGLKMSDKQSFATIYELAKKNGDPMPELTAAQAMLESGYLTSWKTKNLNNPFGQKGTGNRGSDGGWAAYNSLEDAVKDHIKLWQNNYGKYKGMGTYNSPMEGLRANIEAYAPASENDQTQYLKNVANILATMGFDPDNKNPPVDLSSKALIQQRKSRKAGTSKSPATSINQITGNNGRLKEKDMIVVGTFQSDYPQAWYGNNAMLLSEAGQSFNAAVAAAAKEGIDLKKAINSAYRSYEHQEFIASSGKYSVVAAPGTSQHGEGKALDIDTNSPAFEWFKKNGPKYGWYWANIPGDDVHFEYKKGKFKPIPKTTTKSAGSTKKHQGPVSPTSTTTPNVIDASKLTLAKVNQLIANLKPGQKVNFSGAGSVQMGKDFFGQPKKKYFDPKGNEISENELLDRVNAPGGVGAQIRNNRQGGGLIGSQRRRNYSSLSMYPSYDTSGGMMIAIQPIIVEKQVPIPTSQNKTIIFPVPVSVNTNNSSRLRR